MTSEIKMPDIKPYAQQLTAYFSRTNYNVDEWLDSRLAARPLVTPDVVEYLKALVVSIERESVEPLGYNQEQLLELAEATGHKKGTLSILAYLLSNFETVEEIKHD